MGSDHAERDLPFLEQSNNVRSRHVQSVGCLLRGQLGVYGNDADGVAVGLRPRISRNTSNASRGTVAEIGRPFPRGMDLDRENSSRPSEGREATDASRHLVMV